MHIFFINDNNFITDDTVKIDGQDFSHIVKSLRFKTDDNITLFNKNYLFNGVIKNIASKHLIVKILSTKKIKREKFKINLYAALIKLNNFEVIIEKSVETGISNIFPIITQYTQIKPELVQKKKNRWEKIIYESVKQSNNLNFPEIKEPLLFTDAVKSISNNAANIIFHPYTNNTTIKKSDISCSSINIFIGPEGGFSKSEINLAEQNNFYILKLPFNTILRAETACISAITFVRSILYGI